MATGDPLYDLLITALFVLVPEVFLISGLVSLHSACQELSTMRFFEASSESIGWPLLFLTLGLMILGMF